MCWAGTSSAVPAIPSALPVPGAMFARWALIGKVAEPIAAEPLLPTKSSPWSKYWPKKVRKALPPN
jgi:hypothetical protein